MFQLLNLVLQLRVHLLPLLAVADVIQVVVVDCFPVDYSLVDVAAAVTLVAVAVCSPADAIQVAVAVVTLVAVAVVTLVAVAVVTQVAVAVVTLVAVADAVCLTVEFAEKFPDSGLQAVTAVTLAQAVVMLRYAVLHRIFQ